VGPLSLRCNYARRDDDSRKCDASNDESETITAVFSHHDILKKGGASASRQESFRRYSNLIGL
jgi:hypothetical protein